MSKRIPSDGPSRTKATYDNKRPRPAPDPARKQAQREVAKLDAAKESAFNKQINTVGLARTLGMIDTPVPEQLKIKRRI